jgi:hypothetical protein
VKWYLLDCGYRHVDLGGPAAHRASRQLGSHGGRHGYASAVVAEANEHAVVRLVDVGVVILGVRQPPALTMGPVDIAQHRPKPLRVLCQVAQRSRRRNVALHAASANQQPVVRIEPVIDRDAAYFVHR